MLLEPSHHPATAEPTDEPATAEQVEEESVQQISIFHCLEFAVHFQDAESTAAATTTPAAAEPAATGPAPEVTGK